MLGCAIIEFHGWGCTAICGGCRAGYVVDVAQDMWWSNLLCGLLPTQVEVELGYAN